MDCKKKSCSEYPALKQYYEAEDRDDRSWFPNDSCGECKHFYSSNYKRVTKSLKREKEIRLLLSLLSSNSTYLAQKEYDIAKERREELKS
jgi:hypothetical protein